MPEALEDAAWMLEELRISHLAQGVVWWLGRGTHPGGCGRMPPDTRVAHLCERPYATGGCPHGRVPSAA